MSVAWRRYQRSGETSERAYLPVQGFHGGLRHPDPDILRVGVIAPGPGQQQAVDFRGVHPGGHQELPRLVYGHQLPHHGDVEHLHRCGRPPCLQLGEGQAEHRQPGVLPDLLGGIAPGVPDGEGPEATGEARLSKSSLLIAEIQRRYVGGGVLYLVVEGNTHQQMEREGGGHLDQLPLPVPGRGVAFLPSLELQLANSLL